MHTVMKCLRQHLNLPEDQGGFILPIASKSDEACAVPSLVGWERCALPILLAAFGFTCAYCVQFCLIHQPFIFGSFAVSH